MTRPADFKIGFWQLPRPSPGPAASGPHLIGRVTVEVRARAAGPVLGGTRRLPARRAVRCGERGAAGP